MERFNRSDREEVLDCYAFESMEQARTLTQAWLWVYNHERPHRSLGYLPPYPFLIKRQGVSHYPTLQNDTEQSFKSLITTVAN